jgi:MFS family permease
MNNPAFAIPAFRFYILSRCATTLSNQMLMVIIGWQMYDTTHSAYDLGMVGLAQFIPALALCLVVGQVVDRYNRRKILIACYTAQFCIALLLIAGSLAGWLGRDMILFVSVCLGTVSAFQKTGQAAFLPGLVPASAYSRALAIHTAGGQFSTIVGPAIGGFLYVAGAGAVYGLCAALSLFSTAMIYMIRYEPAQTKRKQVTLQSLFAGIGFIWHRKEVLGAISLDLFAVFLGGATALLPIFARDILHTGSWGLGLLRAAPAAGALLVSIYLAQYPIRRRAGKLMFGSVAMYGVATLVFALSSSFVLSLAALMLTGAFDMVSVVIRQSLVQLQTPDDMRGRVSSVNSIFIGASNQLGEFESGITAGWLGAIPSVVIGGASTIFIVLLWMKLFPALTHREELTPD